MTLREAILKSLREEALAFGTGYMNYIPGWWVGVGENAGKIFNVRAVGYKGDHEDWAMDNIDKLLPETPAFLRGERGTDLKAAQKEMWRQIYAGWMRVGYSESLHSMYFQILEPLPVYHEALLKFLMKMSEYRQIGNIFVDDMRERPIWAGVSMKDALLSKSFQGLRDVRETLYYRGTQPGETKRISTGVPEWDDNLFISKSKELAKAYGSSIQSYQLKPGAKVVAEGTKEFSKLGVRPRKGERMLDWCLRVLRAAKANGYDVIEFARQGDIGTVVINKDAVVKIP